MTVKGFYRELLNDIGVELQDIEDARARRDELRAKLASAVGAHSPTVETFPSGALAAGLQIDPLNDVDVVVTVPDFLPEWWQAPKQAMLDVRSWVEPLINASFSFTTHAIQLKYPDEEFTADIVIGVRNGEHIVIPHCPGDGETHYWMNAHPKRHAELVHERRIDGHTAIFAQQVRILKDLNRHWQMSTDDNRKPLCSFHITALALAIFAQGEEVPHDEGTPRFLEAAAQMVWAPLKDPAGLGPDLEARNPADASALLSLAAGKTRKALSMPDEEAVALLNEVFGDPEQRRALLSGEPVSVELGGRFVSTAAATAAVARSVPSVRSHG